MPPLPLKQKSNTMYDAMEFPPYEFHEFPMAVPVVGGVVMDSPYDPKTRKSYPVVIVADQDELDALKGPGVSLVSVTDDAGSTTMRVESEDDIRKVLYVQAEQAGVQIDKRWSVPRIEDALKQAKDVL